MEKCNHKWDALWLRSDGKKAYIQQRCILDKDHDGEHRSWTNVTTRNIKEKNGDQ